MSLNSEGKKSVIHRLGKSQNCAKKEKIRCWPMLVTTSNLFFLQECLASSHYLRRLASAVFIKKTTVAQRTSVEHRHFVQEMDKKERTLM